MTTLWLKFPDEALSSSRFTDSDKQKLEDVFATTPQSVLMRAIKLAGLTPPDAQTRMISWHGDLPYFNWSALIGIISGGTLVAVKSEGGGYTFKPALSAGKLWALIRGYWSMTRFLAKPPTDNDLLAQSIALGFVMQSMVMRLGTHVTSMPQWLAAPDKTPSQHRKIITEIQRIQMRRTAISHVWNDVLANAPALDADTQNAPDHFWDDEPINVASIKPAIGKAMSVCAGIVTGVALAVSDKRDIPRINAAKSAYNAPVILVFRYARPDTTELFGMADGLVFCDGGVLSHACTVAREYNIPAMTQAGQSFFDGLAGDKPVWITMDGAAANISVHQG